MARRFSLLPISSLYLLRLALSIKFLKEVEVGREIGYDLGVVGGRLWSSPWVGGTANSRLGAHLFPC